MVSIKYIILIHDFILLRSFDIVIYLTNYWPCNIRKRIGGGDALVVFNLLCVLLSFYCQHIKTSYLCKCIGVYILWFLNNQILLHKILSLKYWFKSVIQLYWEKNLDKINKINALKSCRCQNGFIAKTML